jgi:hypothetical protein
VGVDLASIAASPMTFRLVFLFVVFICTLGAVTSHAKVVSGTRATVSNITHSSAGVTASVTTDSTESGSYLLRFFVRSPGASTGVYITATPSSIPVSGNATTTFMGSVTGLTCGSSYEVTGVYIDPTGNPYALSAYSPFSTLACPSLTLSPLFQKVFSGVALTPFTVTSTNFNGSPRFSVSPALPTGLVINSSTGAITGTPAGTIRHTRYVITGTGAISGSASAEFALTVAPPINDLDTLRYIASHPDLIEAFGVNIASGREHYLNWGFSEDRKITFEPLNYTASHPDLMSAFGIDETKAVTHYIQWGFKEKRHITFDPLNYIASHVDLITAFGADAVKGARHYIQNGYAEKRQITFDPMRYMASHPDLIQVFAGDETKATTHFIQNGYREQRRITFTDLDALQYVASFSDLIKTVGLNVTAAIRHYVVTGYNTGRRITFDALSYIASYNDLISAFKTNSFLGVQHYISLGFTEGRKVVFDALGYIAAYSDLRAVFGEDTNAATRHYINVGNIENRRYLWTASLNLGKGGRSTRIREYVENGKNTIFYFDVESGYQIGTASGCGGGFGLYVIGSQAQYWTGPITGTCAVNVSFFELKPQIALSGTTVDFGEVTLSLTSDTKFVTVRNSGNTFLSVSGIAISGAGASQYVMSHTCGNVIQVGGSCTISIIFRPTSNGLKAASLVIASNSSTRDTTVALSGVGVDYISKCTNCVELRKIVPGDRWSLSVTEQAVGVVGPISEEYRVERLVSTGPTYSAGGTKTQASVRMTDTYFIKNVASGALYFDYVNEPGDSRIRMLGKGEISKDAWSISTAEFNAGNYPTFFVSPIGVGAEWGFQSDLYGPPCVGCITKQIERYTYKAAVKAIDVIQTPAGTFETFRVEYSIVCRRGYESSIAILGPNLECTNDKYLGESGIVWLHQRLGVVKQDTTIVSGFTSSSNPERTRVIGTLTSTNIQ